MLALGNRFGGIAVSAPQHNTNANWYGGYYWRPRVGGVRAG